MPVWIDAIATIIAAILSSVFILKLTNKAEKQRKDRELEEKFRQFEMKFVTIDNRCRLREATTESQIKEVDNRHRELLQVITDLKETIQPLRNMGTSVAVIEHTVGHIKETISDKIAYIVERVDRNEERIDSLEDKLVKAK